MISSFLSFAIGAAIPLMPFVLGNHSWNLFLSIGLTAISLFVIGMVLSLFTNRNPIFLGARMLFTGAIAGVLTYSIGRMIGAGV